jgi:uncharacterized membrane protein
MTDPQIPPRTPAPRGTGTGRAVRVVLVISLALNLLVAGVVIGGAVNGRMPHHFGGFDMSLGPFERALPPEGRRAVREDMRSRLADRPRLTRGTAGDAAQFIEALRTETFDRTAVEEIFDAHRDHAVRGMRAGQEALLARLEAMSYEERQAFADRLSRELRRRLE